MVQINNKNLIITKPENIFYLTRFKGSFGQVIKTPQKTFLITDSRYANEAPKTCHKNVEIIIIQDYQKDFQNILKQEKIKTLYFESQNLTYSQYLKLEKYFNTTKFKPLTNEIDHLRLVKTKTEIEFLRKSQELNKKVFEKAHKLLKPNITEQELANKIVTIGYDLGAEKVAFDPIVGFGENSASAHSTPTNRKFKPTDIVLLDMGFIYNNYCSDLSRTILPKNPPAEMQKMYNLVQEAQTNCITKIKAGMTGIQADNLSRSIFKQAGVDQFFTHANGHGLGLEIHEAPSLSPKTKHADRKMILQKNMVVTVEPGLYFPNKFGIRIEDIIIIQNSKSQLLTS